MATLHIKAVNGKKDLAQFIDFPHDLYQGDPHYTPELHIGMRDILTPGKHPFHEYGSAQCYLAYQGEKIVGRITSIHNPRYNEHFGSNVGFFGFFDSINDQEVAKALIEQAKSDARARGYDRMIGPTNLTTNDTAGILVDGFNDGARVMMTYNAPYYPQLLEAIGLEKEMDLFAYDIPTDTVSDRTLRIAEALRTRLGKAGITIRTIKLKNLDKEAEQILEVYNEAWIDNWGFVPFTKGEFDFIKNDLKLIALEDFIYVAEHEGRTVGFSVTVPNINEILRKIKRGRLLPTGIFKLLLGKGKTETVRIMAMGVRQAYRRKGIEAVFFANNIVTAQKRGVKAGEASWVLENNKEMIDAAENLNGKKYKTYRLYTATV